MSIGIITLFPAGIVSRGTVTIYSVRQSSLVCFIKHYMLSLCPVTHPWNDYRKGLPDFCDSLRALSWPAVTVFPAA